MGQCVDRVECLGADRQRSFHQCPTAFDITGFAGRKAQTGQVGPIIVQVALHRFKQVQNAGQLSGAAVEDQVAAQLGDYQQITGIGLDIRLSRHQRPVWILKQRYQCFDMGSFQVAGPSRGFNRLRLKLICIAFFGVLGQQVARYRCQGKLRIERQCPIQTLGSAGFRSQYQVDGGLIFFVCIPRGAGNGFAGALIVHTLSPVV
jgi:hypothetical protein